MMKLRGKELVYFNLKVKKKNHPLKSKALENYAAFFFFYFTLVDFTIELGVVAMQTKKKI